VEICHLHVENNSVFQVDIDKVIWTMPVDHNDEMEMRVKVARQAILRIDGEDANRSANSKNTAVEAVVVPQSLSFYTMFYKMTIEDRQIGRKRERERPRTRRNEEAFVLNEEDKHVHHGIILGESALNTNTSIENEENNTQTHSLNSYIYTREENATEEKKYDEKQEHRQRDWCKRKHFSLFFSPSSSSPLLFSSVLSFLSTAITFVALDKSSSTMSNEYSPSSSWTIDDSLSNHLIFSCTANRVELGHRHDSDAVCNTIVVVVVVYLFP
jgi:hypothetical protein